jgi:hypothetical protein
MTGPYSRQQRSASARVLHDMMNLSAKKPGLSRLRLAIEA